MRAAILGCPHKGICFPGYFRVNNEAHCSMYIICKERFDYILFYYLVENLVYQKHTWINDRGLFRSLQTTTTGDSSTKCITMDNYFVEKPIWMIDLGRRRNIVGVILSIQHATKDYFDRFNIYIDRYSHFKHSNLRSSQSFTSSSRLHFQCQKPLNG
jgi:hypothetical protein